MKFCTIGCGGHASHSHGPSQKLYAQRHPEVELSACCDLNPQLAETYRAAFGFQRSYTNLEEMLAKENPDAVALVVPAAATSDLAVPLLERGMALHLEKPPGLTLNEYRRLLAAAQKGGSLNQVAFNRRYAPALVRARQWLDRDIPAGEVLHIRYDLVRYSRNESDFSITAIHGIDAVQYLARSPYREIRLTYRELPQSGTGVAAFSMEGVCMNGTEVSLTFQPMSGLLEETAAIHAIDQSIHVNLLGTQATFDGETSHWCGGALKSRVMVMNPELVERNGIYYETEAFLNAVQGIGTVSPQLQDCRQQVILMEAIRTRKSRVDFADRDATRSNVSDAARQLSGIDR